MSTWVMIPARGGSVGVPRKNVRRLKNKPLISWTIEAALGATAANTIIVMTDDDEIAGIAERHGVRVMREEKTTGKQTLDDVARKVIHQLIQEGEKVKFTYLKMPNTFKDSVVSFPSVGSRETARYESNERLHPQVSF